jgi:hypothetical protein
MTAGILEEHGIPAWVWGDLSSSSYGMVTTGGCRVMVNEEDKEEAERVMQTPPPPAEERAGEPEPERKPFSVWRALGTGVVNGAVFLPVALVVVTLLLALGFLVMQLLQGQWPPPRGFLPGLGRVLGSLPLPGVLYGVVLGLCAGLTAWLISDFKRQGRAGKLFAGLMVVLMAIIALLL